MILAVYYAKSTLSTKTVPYISTKKFDLIKFDTKNDVKILYLYTIAKRPVNTGLNFYLQLSVYLCVNALYPP